MMWIAAAAAAAAFASLATLIGVVGLCRAAAEGDRAMHAHHPPLDEMDRAWWAELDQLEDRP